MSNEKKYTLEELTGQPPRTTITILTTIGLLVVAIGTLLPILNVYCHSTTINWWKYVYATGAVCFLAGKLLSPYTGIHPRIKRLRRIESWSAIFFCVAAFFMFWNTSTMRDVWAFTLAGGVLMIFTTIAIPQAIKKELQNSQKKKK